MEAVKMILAGFVGAILISGCGAAIINPEFLPLLYNAGVGIVVSYYVVLLVPFIIVAFLFSVFFGK